MLAIASGRRKASRSNRRRALRSNHTEKRSNFVSALAPLSLSTRVLIRGDVGRSRDLLSLCGRVLPSRVWVGRGSKPQSPPSLRTGPTDPGFCRVRPTLSLQRHELDWRAKLPAAISSPSRQAGESTSPGFGPAPGGLCQPQAGGHLLKVGCASQLLTSLRFSRGGGCASHKPG